MAKKQSKKAGKFDILPEEWRNDMMGRKDPEELRKFIHETAVNQVELAAALAADEDVARLKEQLKTAKAQYTEGKKTNSAKFEFLVECLKSMGIAIKGFSKKEALAEARANQPPVKQIVKDGKTVDTDQV
jgi:protein-disulfide isomerase-like protein with CxxC motif